jgi:hypothetical protein
MPFTLGQSEVYLKLYRIKGFFVSDFYVLAENQAQAEERAQQSLTFTVEECEWPVDETV